MKVKDQICYDSMTMLTLTSQQLTLILLLERVKYIYIFIMALLNSHRMRLSLKNSLLTGVGHVRSMSKFLFHPSLALKVVGGKVDHPRFYISMGRGKNRKIISNLMLIPNMEFLFPKSLIHLVLLTKPFNLQRLIKIPLRFPWLEYADKKCHKCLKTVLQSLFVMTLVIVGHLPVFPPLT